MADARGRAFRKSQAKGVDDVRSWLAKFCGESVDELTVQQIEVPIPSTAQLERADSDQALLAAFRNKRDSDLHSLLKYAAWIWLNKEDSRALPFQSQLVRYEQKVYLPNLEPSEFVTRYHPLGGEFDQTKAQVLRRGDDEVFIGDGFVITIDVYGRGTHIEVGNTQPFNLLSPLMDMLSIRAIWIPYPTRPKPKEFVLDSHQFESLPAYEVTYSDVN